MERSAFVVFFRVQAGAAKGPCAACLGEKRLHPCSLAANPGRGCRGSGGNAAQGSVGDPAGT